MNEHVALPVSSGSAIEGPARASSAPPLGKVFVSYSRKDGAFAQGLVSHLVASGFEAFLDKTDIAPGDPWQERLAALIAAADTVVFVVSPHSTASEVCAWELEESARRGKRLVPIVARRIADTDAPKSLGRLNWIFCAEGDDREAALASLDQALLTDLPWVREHTRLGELARRWDEGQRARSATLRGADLEAAERWLDGRPADGNAPTELHQDFIRASRRGASLRQRIWVGGSLVAALIAIALAGFAEVSRLDAQHQRRQADSQRASAETARNEAQAQRDRAEAALGEARIQRDRAERTLVLATNTANELVFDLARKFRNVVGVPASTVKAILDRAVELQDQLVGAGETAPALRRSQNIALTEIVDTLLSLGDTQAALAAARKGRDIMIALLATTPDNALWRRDLSIAHHKVGDVLMAQGKLPEALLAYRAGLAIDEAFAKDDPGNPLARRNLSISYNKIGSVERELGDLDAARKSFAASLAVKEALAREQPRNTELQHDLSVSYDNVGEALAMQGDLVGALRSFEASLAIRRELATSDPGNTAWQRGLSLSYNRVGDVLSAQDKPGGALKSYTAGFEIRERLTKSDPGNASWQLDLSASYDKIGDALMDEGKLPEALKSFEESFAIIEKVANSDPSKANAQYDLSVAYKQLAGVYRKTGELEKAREALLAGQAILARLVEQHPQSRRWKQSLDWLDKEIAALDK